VRDGRSRSGSEERDSDVLTTGDSPEPAQAASGWVASPGRSTSWPLTKGRVSADQGDEAGRVDGAPAGLR